MIRVGIVGLGAAGQAFLPALEKHPDFDLVAVCDKAKDECAVVAKRLNIEAFDDLGTMLSNANLDAVYVATPTDLHLEHVCLALRAGKHVLVEKPMAIKVSHALEMVEASKVAGVVLAVGHSHSYDLPIQKMREIIRSGRLGRVRMINTWCYTDWVYRPRRPEELRSDLGGGVTFRQGAHQFDIMKSLCGEPVRSVFATTFDWDEERSTTGAHSVTLKFAGGAIGTAVYNGYGHFSTTELTDGVGEWGFIKKSGPPAHKKQLAESEVEELARKRERARTAIQADAPHQPHFGLTIVSCEKGEIRQSPDGLYIYSREGKEEIVLPLDKSPRDLVLDEFADAVLGRNPCLHDGRWGAGILEICSAALRSSQSGVEIELEHQGS